MRGWFPGARGRKPRAAAWIVATVAGGVALAQSASEPPDFVGFQAGHAVIAPSLTVGYSYDTNVLQKPEAANPSADGVLTVSPALTLLVPFSNSQFKFADVFEYRDYSTTPQTQGKSSNDAEADLELNFSSHDQLALNAHNIAGVAETLAFDPFGRTAFQGNSYQLHTQAVAVTRLISGARGYRFGVMHNALRFDPTNVVNFFNYRGFDAELAYVQPLSPNTRISFGYLSTSYDHSLDQNPSTVVRTENGDVLYTEIEGQLGPKQPYKVRLGWERLLFEGPAAIRGDNFTGVVGQAQLGFIVGGGTTFTVSFQRQPYRSYVVTSNYYLTDLLGGAVARDFRSGASVGGDAAFGASNSYEVSANTGLAFYRQDRTVQMDVYANLPVARRVFFKVSLSRYRRYSNAPGADYNNTVAFGGLVFGWI